MFLSVEDHQVRFFFCKLCVVLGFLFKKLLPYWNYWLWARISLLVQEWSGCYLSLSWTCLIWTALFSMLLSGHNLQEQKRHSFYGLQTSSAVDIWNMLSVTCGLEDFSHYIEYQISSEWKFGGLVFFSTQQIPPINQYLQFTWTLCLWSHCPLSLLDCQDV